MIQMGMGQKHEIDRARRQIRTGPRFPRPVRGRPETGRNRPECAARRSPPDGRSRLRPAPRREMKVSCRHRRLLTRAALPFSHTSAGCFARHPKRFRQTRTVPGLRRRSRPSWNRKFGIEDLAPIGFPDQHNRNRRRLAGLGERQHLEQFIQGAEAAGKRHQRPRPHHEMQFAQREIAKFEAQFGADIGIGKLLMRQGNIEADRFGADIAGARDWPPP